jgi:hypothetical protein
MNYSEPMNRIPLYIQFRHMPNLRFIRQTAEEQLERFAPLAVPGARCEVVIDEDRPAQKSGAYNVVVRLRIPGHRLYVAHDSVPGGSLDMLHGIVLSAFADIRRQMIKSRARRRRQRVFAEAC